MPAVALLSFALLAQFMGSPMPMSVQRSRTAPRSTDFLPSHNFKLEEVAVTLRKYHDAVLVYRQGRTAEQWPS